MSPEPDDRKIEELVRQTETIIKDPNSLYDVVGKRLAFRSAELQRHFLDPSNKITFGILGNPNSGKTTFAYSCFRILDVYGLPAHYHDLDVYTRSGDAMAGKVSWQQRTKKTQEQVGPEGVQHSIQELKEVAGGIVIADFPGMIDDPFQKMRLKAIDLAIIFVKTIDELDEWTTLCSGVNRGFRFLITHRTFPNFMQPVEEEQAVMPIISDMDRRVVFNPATLTITTSILEEAAVLTHAPKSNYHAFFTQAELTVLEEFLDPMFSIQTV